MRLTFPFQQITLPQFIQSRFLAHVFIPWVFAIELHIPDLYKRVIQRAILTDTDGIDTRHRAIIAADVDPSRLTRLIVHTGHIMRAGRQLGEVNQRNHKPVPLSWHIGMKHQFVIPMTGGEAQQETLRRGDPYLHSHIIIPCPIRWKVRIQVLQRNLGTRLCFTTVKSDCEGLCLRTHSR